MPKSDPTKDPGFQRTLRNLLTAPPKRQADMKIGQAKAKKHAATGKSVTKTTRNPSSS